MFYLFYRFIKEGRDDIPTDICDGIIASVEDLLRIDVEIPKLDDSEADLLTEMVSSAFDSQLYLYETAGILCSLLFKTPEQQASLLLSLVKPLMAELSVNLQAATKGSQELVPIVKVHHIIMALGNISKGFPDYPQPPPPGYILPPLDVFAQVAQAIIVCLEAMNVIKIVRDAVSTFVLGFCLARCSLSAQTRFAFARILASAGPSVTHFIPPLMSNLLAHFEPSELVDFMNFISLLIRKLQVCLLSETYHLSPKHYVSSERYVRCT